LKARLEVLRHRYRRRLCRKTGNQKISRISEASFVTIRRDGESDLRREFKQPLNILMAIVDWCC